MKVISVCTNNNQGGAAKAAYRIHKGLLNLGVESTMLVQESTVNEPQIVTPYKSTVSKIWAKIRPLLGFYLLKLQKSKNTTYHSLNIIPSKIPDILNNSDADIIHLNWVNSEMLSIKDISKIKKPIVWTLHDMWCFCGAEHVDYQKKPGRYIDGYTKKNRPKSFKGMDLDRWTWKRKKKHWKNNEFNFVTPSRWLSECLKESELFKGIQSTIIPNGLDINLFKPINKKIAKKILNIADNKKVILFGAVNSDSDPLKGYQQFHESKKELDEKADYEYLVFGNSHKYKEGNMNFLGRVNDDIALSIIYSAADVMVVPSILESFGQTASEALSCGTPVVAFETSGLKDIINHKVNGYMATPYDSSGLVSGIKWILGHEDYTSLSLAARNTVEQKFSDKIVAQKYLELYYQILENKQA